MLEKASSITADAVVFDLEDSVAPATKPEARKLVRATLDSRSSDLPQAFVRLNAPSSGMLTDDASVIADHPDVGIVITKVDRPAALERLRDIDALRDRTTIVTIETPRALLDALAIAEHPLVDGIALGGEDLALAVGMRRTSAGDELDYARLQVLLAARAAGIAAFDAICPEFRDGEIVRHDAERAARMGFDGKFAIHPGQLDAIHAAFRPSTEELKWAKRVVDAYDAALDDGQAAVQVDGQMIDPPIAERYRKLLARWGGQTP